MENIFLLLKKEDILIARKGEVIAVLSSLNHSKVAIAMSLFGILSSDTNLEEVKEERLNSI